MSTAEELTRLVEAVRDGHPERISELLARSAGFVHALARARLGDTLAAEEAAADALARAARGLPGLAAPRAYLRWLARIAGRCAADTARRIPAGLSPAAAEPVDPGMGPAGAAEAAERARGVRVAVATLPLRLRVPVLLHYAEGLSCREIAAATGAGLGTVSRRLRKALGILRSRLGETP